MLCHGLVTQQIDLMPDGKGAVRRFTLFFLFFVFPRAAVDTGMNEVRAKQGTFLVHVVLRRV